MRRRFTLPVLGLWLCLAACHKEKADSKLLYVSAEATGEVVVIDPQVAHVLVRIPVGKRPRGLKVSRDGRSLYVALSGSPRRSPNTDDGNPPPAKRAADGIGVVDLVERRLVKTLPSGQDPTCFDLSLDGKTLFVSNGETAALSVVDLESGTIKRTISVGEGPDGVTVRPDGKVVYVASQQSNNVTAIDTTSFERIADIAAGMRPRVIAFTKDGRLGFVSNELGGTLTAFDARANKPLGTITVEANSPSGERPVGLAVSPNGAELFVSTGRGGAVAVIDVATRQFARLICGVGARPWGIAVASDGKRAFTANGPSDDVSIIDLANGKVEKRLAIGGSPWAVVTGAY